MDDLQLVRELDETPLKSADELAAARAHLVAGMKPRKRGRAGIIAVVTIGLAAAVVAVVMMLPSRPVQHNAALTSSAAPVDTAVQLLNHAAAAARSKPDQVPRPDKFLYVCNGEWEGWFSVDGAHDGRVITRKKDDPVTLPGCIEGRMVVRDKEDQVIKIEACAPRRVYRDDLPANADEMLKHLERAGGEDQPAKSIGKDVAGMVVDTYLPGPQRAALFEAAARVPGLGVVHDVSSGRPAVRASGSACPRTGGPSRWCWCSTRTPTSTWEPATSRSTRPGSSTRWVTASRSVGATFTDLR